MCALARRAALVCKANTVCMFARLTQTDCRGAVLCRVHYLIRVNFSNNPLLARVDHALQGAGGGGGAESLIAFPPRRRSSFPPLQIPALAVVCTQKKNASPLNGRERENKTSRGVAPVFKLLINAIGLWSASSPRATGQLVFQWMQCFMYHEADSYWGTISYITKVLLMYAQRLGGQS